MISKIEAINYRVLRNVHQDLDNFAILVGPNASGKSTFLDVPAFLADLVRAGLDGAVHGDRDIPLRASDPQHLTWLRSGKPVELAIEMRNGGDFHLRYELSFGSEEKPGILGENLFRLPVDSANHMAEESPSCELFPQSELPVKSLLFPSRQQLPRGWKKILRRSDKPEQVIFQAETNGWTQPFKIGTNKTALASLPEDEEKFPAATWFRQTLLQGVQRIALSSEAMRLPSPPSRRDGFLPDGSNLPHVVHRLESKNALYAAWIRHIREALPNIQAVTTREREEDRHRYLVLKYVNGLEAPSWLVSDGTLRLLALTLLAYASDDGVTFLVEEPENGIHPKAVETVFQSLSSVRESQVLCATHSPVVLSMATLEQTLCFGRGTDGATAIVSGAQHPQLKKWRGGMDLGDLFASGVLS